MASNEPWMTSARRYVVSSDSALLTQARDLCEDAEIKQFLAHELDSDMEAGSDPMELADNLRSSGRLAQAALIELVAKQDSPDDLAAIAEQHEFWECAAYFHYVVGTFLLRAKSTSDAVEHFSRAAELGRRECSTDSDRIQLSRVLCYLGDALSNAENFTSARSAYDESLGIAREMENRGGTTGWVAQVYNNLGNCLRNLGELPGAENALRQSLALRQELERSDPEQHRDAASQSLRNLGPILKQQRRHDEAAAVLEDARERKTEPTSADARVQLDEARTLMNIASAQFETRSLDSACKTYERALELLDRIRKPASQLKLAQYGLKPGFLDFGLGAPPSTVPCDADIAHVHACLGMIYRQRERWKVAEGHLREAETIYRRLTEHEDATHQAALAGVLVDLAGVLADMRQFESARSLMADARPIHEALRAADPAGQRSSYATFMIECGLLLAAQQDASAAAECFRTAAGEYEALRARAPEAHASELALALANQALSMVNCGDESWPDTCKAAIRTAESAEAPQFAWLSKGRVGACYPLLAKHAASKVNFLLAFGCLAALRNPEVRALQKNTSVLHESLQALREVEALLKRRISFVVAHRFTGYSGVQGSLLGIFSSDMPYFTAFEEPEFHARASGLMLEIESCFDAKDTRSFESRVAAFNALVNETRSYLPAKIRNELARTDRDVLISGDTFWTSFPWDVLSSPDDPRTLARWPDISAAGLARLRPITLGTDSPSAAVVCPWNAISHSPLKGAKDEAQKVSRLLAGLGYSLLPAGKPLIGKLAT